MTCAPCTPGTPPRVAYAVGRAVGPAVVRNRVRRRLREAVRAERDGLRDGHAYLVAAAPSARDASVSDMRTALRAILTELDGAE